MHVNSFLKAITSILVAALFVWGVGPAPAQGLRLTKVAYQEPTHSIFYAPAYIALSRNYFKENGLDVDLQTAQGGDKVMAALLSGGADIALIGPEYPIYVWIGQSPLKVKIFSGLTASDGTFLVRRGKNTDFNWGELKGKKILGWRKGSTPTLFLEAALRNKGVNPESEVEINNNIGIPARYGAFVAGTADYAIFFEPDASRLEREGVATIVSSIGEIVGPIDYTAFVATDDYIARNPKILQAWTNAIYRAQRWLASASLDEAATGVAPFFPGIARADLLSSLDRYRRTQLWKTTPVVEPEAMQKFEQILVAGGTLKPDQHVQYGDVVEKRFAEQALKEVR